jgi:hypothetical protein
MSKLIAMAEAKSIKAGSRVDFQTQGGGNWPEWDRFITLDGRRAHHVGNICGTCPFLFERLEGANEKVSPTELSNTLRNGIKSIDQRVIDVAMEILPTGAYKVLLLSCVPRFISPSGKGDYFFEEQIQLWGVDGFWGVPHYAKNEYYRSEMAKIGNRGALFEFVVPMFPKRYLHEETIQSYDAILSHPTIPTALAVSILDVKQPATWMGNPEITTHWCLAHYLLDGHHKICAAAKAGKPISILSFLAIEKGVSGPDQIAETLKTLAQD